MKKHNFDGEKYKDDSKQYRFDYWEKGSTEPTEFIYLDDPDEIYPFAQHLIYLGYECGIVNLWGEDEYWV